MYIYVCIFVFLLSLSIVDLYSRRYAFYILLFVSFLMILFIGLRGYTGADSYNYISFFKESTTTVWECKSLEKGYAEYGFYYLSVILKSIWNNPDFYFIAISFLTFTFLLKAIKIFAIYPLLGFCVYYARFLMFRDMNQIRAALAIVIVIYALSFLVKQETRKYFWWVLFATTLHYSASLAFIFGWVYTMKLTTPKVGLVLMFSAFIGVMGELILKPVLISAGFSIFLTYINTTNLGLANPVILFQVVFCFLFFYFEDLLQERQYGYYVLRNAYLFSTVILLVTANLGEIGGRLATLFATCEIFIIPALISTIRPRILSYGIIVVIISLIFYLNYSKMLLLPDVWEYNL